MKNFFKLSFFKYIPLLLLLFSYFRDTSCNGIQGDQFENNYFKYIKMPKVAPTKKDDYLCTGIALNSSKEEWVLRYDPLASANIAHHMLLYGCSSLSKNQLDNKFWDCGHHGVCGGSRIMFAWAKNALASKLPNNVGFKIGGKSGIKYLTLQVHYANVLPQGVTDESGLKMKVTVNPQMYKAGIYLLVAGFVDIPPLAPKTHADINCKVGDTEPTDIHIFGFRVHAHVLGSVITGYKYESETGTLTEIVKGNPQWPQAFYPLDSILTVRPQDILHARCTYNSTSRSRHTYIGQTSDDEMCNLYLMYYTDSEKGSESGVCGRESFHDLTSKLPASSDEPLPPNSMLEEMTQGDNRNKDKEISYNDIFDSSKNTGQLKSTFNAEKALAAYSPKSSTAQGNEVSNIYYKTFRMPGVSPSQPDAYICTAMVLNQTQEQWILGYKPIASANRAHHMLLFGCSDVNVDFLEKGHWDCGHHGVCGGGRIMYAWAKNAPSTSLPDNVGFRVGGNSGIKYLTLQIHYAFALPPDIKDNSGLQMSITNKRQQFKAGIFLLAAGYVDIPPHSENTHADINCRVGETEPVNINIFAYRVHAHKFGTVITGYKYNPENYELFEFAKGNPQWPQAFYPMNKVLQVSPQEILHARCTFNASTSNKHVYIGGTGDDEMCNLYLMYFTDAEKGSESGGCGGETFQSLTAALPPSSDQPLPPNPELKEMTHGENKNLDKEISYKSLFSDERPIALDKKTHSRKDPLPEDERFQLKPKPVEIYEDNLKETDVGKIQYFGQSKEKLDKSSVPEHNQETLMSQTRQGKQLTNSSAFELVENWGPSNYHLGQVTSIGVDSRGDLVVFHRGERTWDGSTFSFNNILVDQSSPIRQAAVLHLQRDSGNVMHEWGANFFYMPHGLTIDDEDKIWLTDVGMHQVFQFPSGYGEGKPLIILGTKFVPGSDDNHFCKPTAVAIMKNKEFFVADGYCNARIIHYSPNGQIIKQFGARSQSILGFNIGSPDKGTFNVPHALALVEDRMEICVADRENGRVQCFKTDSGEFQRMFKLNVWGSRLFSVTYTPHFGGRLFAVNGPQFTANSKVEAYEVNYSDGKFISSFSPLNAGFSNPHDIALSEDGREVYVAEIAPNKIWKFVLNGKINLNTSTLGKVDLEVRTGQLKEVIAQSREDPSYVDGWSSVGILAVVLGLIAVPIIVLSTLTIIVRCKESGLRNRYLDNNKLLNAFTGTKKGSGLTLGSLLNKHHGFEKVSTNDIQEDDLDSADSDIEEFSLTATKV